MKSTHYPLRLKSQEQADRLQLVADSRKKSINNTIIQAIDLYLSVTSPHPFGSKAWIIEAIEAIPEDEDISDIEAMVADMQRQAGQTVTVGLSS